MPKEPVDLPAGSRSTEQIGASSLGGADGVMPSATDLPISSDSLDSPIDHGRYVPGTILAGRYRIVALVGRGGMGEVYRADDLKLGQTVALKFLPGAAACEPGRVARFHKEVRLARQVTHPNVCRVYDIGEAEGPGGDPCQFLSMEYVAGEDLASLLRRVGRLAPDKALDITRQLCAGLAAAHQKGVLHRDLKPSNILIDGRGQALITDFGLSTLASDVARGEGPVAMIGTPAYMAPEQISGHAPSVQSDLYSVGLIVYELFTGKTVFAGGPAAEVIKLRRATAATASRMELPGEIDPAVRAAVLLSVEEDPGRRPASAEALLATLPGAGGAAANSPAAAAAHAVTPSGSAPVLSNLPRQVTSFVGRSRELQEIKQLLGQTQLLTLTGAGGTGKSRLSLRVASELLPQFADGVWVVELAPLSDPALVAQAVTSVLNVREEASRPLAQTLAERLGQKQLLLVLDNCEHVLAACAEVADTLLRGCDNVRILASSREALNLPGETTYRVPSLSLPARSRGQAPVADDAQTIGGFEAIRLFVERARAVLPSFGLTDSNASAVVQVCQRLDGIPLAIELAAARLRSLTIEEINARLDDRFRLLTGGSRTALPRQQTLRALINWSYDLLKEQERRLFCRLSVFAGGWTLEAAEKVCSGEGIDEGDVLDLLAGLVDKSLVALERERGRTRYRLLETIRQYALDRLMDANQVSQSRLRHLAHYRALAESAGAHGVLRGRDFDPDRLEADHENLRAAFDFAVEDPAGAEAALCLGGDLFVFWGERGHYREMRGRLTAALAASASLGRTERRAWALVGAADACHRLGDHAEAHRLLEESLAIRREIGEPRAIANSLFNYGNVLNQMGQLAAARERLEEALRVAPPSASGGRQAAIVCNLAETMTLLGDYDAALKLFGEALDGLRPGGRQDAVAEALCFVGRIAQARGDLRSAQAHYRESLSIVREQHLADLSGWFVGPYCLADLARAMSRDQRAVTLYAAHDAQRAALALPVPPVFREEYHQAMAQLRASLGEPAFNEAYARGYAMSAERAIAYGLEESPVPSVRAEAAEKRAE